MNNLMKIFFVVFFASASLQAQAIYTCDHGNVRTIGKGNIDDPESDFNNAEVVATVRKIGSKKDEVYFFGKYKVIKSWKGSKPGKIISTRIFRPDCGILECYFIHDKGTTLVYFNRDPHDAQFMVASRCAMNLHASEKGYAKRIRWLNANTRRKSRR
jgi:hypothetical protein